MTDNTPPIQYESIGSAAARLGLNDRTIRKYIADGILPAYRAIGRKSIRLRVDEVDAVMKPVNPWAQKDTP